LLHFSNSMIARIASGALVPKKYWTEYTSARPVE